MKKMTLLLTTFLMTCTSMVCSASAESFPTDADTWASFNDNQKSLYYALDEIEEEITGVFEYLGNIYMADGTSQVVDLLFVEAPEAEDGIYIYDIATGELYDHINQKKIAEEFETMEHCINTLANCYQNYASSGEFLWMDSEIKIHLSEEDIQAVLSAKAGVPASENTSDADTAAVSDSAATAATVAPALTKEDMLAQAVDADATLINNESFENFARAKQTYCNQTIKLKGTIQAIAEDHIELGCNSTYVIDVYLPMEEILMLDVGQSIVVVGQTSDEIIDSSDNIAEYTFEYIHYQMPTAYLVQDRLEITGVLKGVNSSYAPAFNIKIGDSNVLKLIYFSENVDTSTLGFDQEITFTARCVKGSLDWEYLDAEIIE